MYHGYINDKAFTIKAFLAVSDYNVQKINWKVLMMIPSYVWEGFMGCKLHVWSISGESSLYRQYFRIGDAVHFHVVVNLALKGCSASSTGRVSATLNIERCKPLSTRVPLHPGSICLDKFVNGLAVTCRSRFFHRALCLFIRRTHALASLVMAASIKERVLARMVQKWWVVWITLRGGSTSVMGLQ